MAILNILNAQTGLVGVLPSLAYIYTNSTEAEILVTGFLNHEVQQGFQFSMPCIAAVSTKETPTSQPKVGWYQVAHVGTNWSLIPGGSPGDVTLPTIANHIATYTNTTGTLSEDPATAISGGNIQAGLSGTAGYLASFPATLAKGSLRLTAVANTGDTLVTISNAAHGQATVYSIPDSGASTANFILSKTTGTQHITVGSLQVDAGTLISGLATGGFVGKLQLFPTTTTTGSLSLQATPNSGSFATIITNAAQAQATTLTIPDIGAATGGIVVATTAIIMKSVAGAAAAGGAADQSFSDAFCTSGSNVVGNWNTQASAASVLKIVPGNGSFVVTSSADAGVGTFNYIITK